MSFWINTMKCQNCGTEVNVSGGMVGTQSMGPATLECAKPGCGNKGFENFVNLGPVKVPQVVFEAADSTDVLELKAKLEVAESLLDAYIKEDQKTKEQLKVLDKYRTVWWALKLWRKDWSPSLDPSGEVREAIIQFEDMAGLVELEREQ